MKKYVFTLLATLFALSVYAKDIKELIVTTIPPMSCQNCENKIKKGDLRFVKGVKKIETNLKDQRVIIEYDADKTDFSQIENAFHKTGYNIEVINTDTEDKSESSGPAITGCCGGCCSGN